jgi:hypothetical protein
VRAVVGVDLLEGVLPQRGMQGRVCARQEVEQKGRAKGARGGRRTIGEGNHERFGGVQANPFVLRDAILGVISYVIDTLVLQHGTHLSLQAVDQLRQPSPAPDQLPIVV